MPSTIIVALLLMNLENLIIMMKLQVALGVQGDSDSQAVEISRFKMSCK